MKLTNIIPETEKRFTLLRSKIDLKNYFEVALQNHYYARDFETWAAIALINALYKASEICDLYRQYNCNDSHFVSLGKYFLRKYELI